MNPFPGCHKDTEDDPRGDGLPPRSRHCPQGLKARESLVLPSGSRLEAHDHGLRSQWLQQRGFHEHSLWNS